MYRGSKAQKFKKHLKISGKSSSDVLTIKLTIKLFPSHIKLDCHQQTTLRGTLGGLERLQVDLPSLVKVLLEGEALHVDSCKIQVPPTTTSTHVQSRIL